jgi:hypothetical protein
MGKSPERFERSCSSLSTPPPQPPFRAGARRRYLAQPTLPVSSVGSREALSHTSCWLILRPLSLALGATGAPARGEAHRAGGWECGRAAIRRDQVYSPRRVQTASAHALSCVPRGSLGLLPPLADLCVQAGKDSLRSRGGCSIHKRRAFGTSAQTRAGSRPTPPTPTSVRMPDGLALATRGCESNAGSGRLE